MGSGIRAGEKPTKTDSVTTARTRLSPPIQTVHGAPAGQDHYSNDPLLATSNQVKKNLSAFGGTKPFSPLQVEIHGQGGSVDLEDRQRLTAQLLGDRPPIRQPFIDSISGANALISQITQALPFVANKVNSTHDLDRLCKNLGAEELEARAATHQAEKNLAAIISMSLQATLDSLCDRSAYSVMSRTQLEVQLQSFLGFSPASIRWTAGAYRDPLAASTSVAGETVFPCLLAKTFDTQGKLIETFAFTCEHGGWVLKLHDPILYRQLVDFTIKAATDASGQPVINDDLSFSETWTINPVFEQIDLATLDPRITNPRRLTASQKLPGKNKSPISNNWIAVEPHAPLDFGKTLEPIVDQMLLIANDLQSEPTVHNEPSTTTTISSRPSAASEEHLQVMSLFAEIINQLSDQSEVSGKPSRRAAAGANLAASQKNISRILQRGIQFAREKELSWIDAIGMRLKGAAAFYGYPMRSVQIRWIIGASNEFVQNDLGRTVFPDDPKNAPPLLLAELMTYDVDGHERILETRAFHPSGKEEVFEGQAPHHRLLAVDFALPSDKSSTPLRQSQAAALPLPDLSTAPPVILSRQLRVSPVVVPETIVALDPRVNSPISYLYFESASDHRVTKNYVTFDYNGIPVDQSRQDHALDVSYKVITPIRNSWEVPETYAAPSEIDSEFVDRWIRDEIDNGLLAELNGVANQQELSRLIDQIPDDDQLVKSNFSLTDDQLATPRLLELAFFWKQYSGTIDRSKFPWLADFVAKIGGKPQFTPLDISVDLYRHELAPYFSSLTLDKLVPRELLRRLYHIGASPDACRIALATIGAYRFHDSRKLIDQVRAAIEADRSIPAEDRAILLVALATSAAPSWIDVVSKQCAYRGMSHQAIGRLVHRIHQHVDPVVLRLLSDELDRSLPQNDPDRSAERDELIAVFDLLAGVPAERTLRRYEEFLSTIQLDRPAPSRLAKQQFIVAKNHLRELVGKSFKYARQAYFADPDRITRMEQELLNQPDLIIFPKDSLTVRWHAGTSSERPLWSAPGFSGNGRPILIADIILKGPYASGVVKSVIVSGKFSYGVDPFVPSLHHRIAEIHLERLPSWPTSYTARWHFRRATDESIAFVDPRVTAPRNIFTVQANSTEIIAQLSTPAESTKQVITEFTDLSRALDENAKQAGSFLPDFLVTDARAAAIDEKQKGSPVDRTLVEHFAEVVKSSTLELKQTINRLMGQLKQGLITPATAQSLYQLELLRAQGKHDKKWTAQIEFMQGNIEANVRGLRTTGSRWPMQDINGTLQLVSGELAEGRFAIGESGDGTGLTAVDLISGRRYSTPWVTTNGQIDLSTTSQRLFTVFGAELNYMEGVFYFAWPISPGGATTLKTVSCHGQGFRAGKLDEFAQTVSIVSMLIHSIASTTRFLRKLKIVPFVKQVELVEAINALSVGPACAVYWSWRSYTGLNDQLKHGALRPTDMSNLLRNQELHWQLWMIWTSFFMMGMFGIKALDPKTGALREVGHTLTQSPAYNRAVAFQQSLTYMFSYYGVSAAFGVHEKIGSSGKFAQPTHLPLTANADPPYRFLIHWLPIRFPWADVLHLDPRLFGFLRNLLKAKGF